MEKWKSFRIKIEEDLKILFKEQQQIKEEVFSQGICEK